MARFFHSLCGLIAASLAAVTIWSAWDFGGAHYNTQLIVAVVILALVPLGLLAAYAERKRSGGTEQAGSPLKICQPSLLVVLAAVACGLAMLQTLPLPVSLVRWLSPGSAAAYQDWIPAPLLAEAATHESLASLPTAGSRVPTSVAVTYTRLALALPALFGLTVWLGSLTISRRPWGIVFLTATAVAGGGYAFFGLADTIRLSRDHEVELRQRLIISPVGADKPFGPFVNNNNGAGYLNLSIGCALALLTIASRSSQASRAGRTTHRSPMPAATGVPSWRGIACILLTALLVAAILGSGSRGGFLGTLAGGAAVGLSLLRGQKRLWGILGSVVILLIAVWMLDALGMRQQSRERLQTLVEGQAMEDPRLDHWSDSLTAAVQYLPAGSGMGAYRFAFLPYQKDGGPGWFQNADGMPVEWILEGGVWMLPLVLAGIVALLGRLRYLAKHRQRLPTSERTYAEALLTALTFMLPAMMVSQCFDFGILLPPLLLTLAAVCGGAMGLAARLRHPLDPSPQGPASGATGRRAQAAAQVSFVVALLLLVGSLAFTLEPLRDAAVVQQMRLVREALIRRPAASLPDYTADIQRLRGIVDRRPHDSEARTLLASLLLDQQRQRGASFLLEKQLATSQQATRMVSPRNVRKAFYSQQPPGSLPLNALLMPTQDLSLWREAREHALGGLLLCPLDDRPRRLLIELDMLHPAANAATRELLQQCRRLRIRNDKSLQQIKTLSDVYSGS